MSNKTKQRARALQASTGMSYQAARDLNGSKRPLPKFAGFTDDGKVFVRAFDLRQGPKFDALPLSAEIVGKSLVLRIHDFTIVLPAIEVHRDQQGEVVVLARQTVREPCGLTITVGVEKDKPDFMPEGSFIIEGVIAVAMTRSALPAKVPMSAGESLTVYLDAVGTPTGTSSAWKRPAITH